MSDVLRYGTVEMHRCEFPNPAVLGVGAVWRCPSCGCRYTAQRKRGSFEAAHPYSVNGTWWNWQRRYWPWPR